MNEGTQQSAARKGGAGDRKGSGTLLSRILAYEVRRTTALLAGVFDAGLSSLATFGVGFFARPLGGIGFVLPGMLHPKGGGKE